MGQSIFPIIFCNALMAAPIHAASMPYADAFSPKHETLHPGSHCCMWLSVRHCHIPKKYYCSRLSHGACLIMHTGVYSYSTSAADHTVGCGPCAPGG